MASFAGYSVPAALDGSFQDPFDMNSQQESWRRLLQYQQGAQYHQEQALMDHADFESPTVGMGDDGDDAEIASRPRLTKDQVNLLEDHFQKNHKPNSETKNHLADIINLPIARVNVSPLSKQPIASVLIHPSRIGFRIDAQRRSSRRSSATMSFPCRTSCSKLGCMLIRCILTFRGKCHPRATARILW